MSVRPLIVDEALKGECRRLREHAENPKHWYVFGETDFVPGDRPEYVLKTEFGFRVVFTITHAPEHSPKPFRHMSISVPGEHLPNPIVVYTLAHHLGFTGAEAKDDVVTEPGPWGIRMNDVEHCIVVQQPYEETHA